jgi:hypothetical protein
MNMKKYLKSDVSTDKVTKGFLRVCFLAAVIAATAYGGCSSSRTSNFVGSAGTSSLVLRLRGTEVVGINCHFTVYVNETKVGAATATTVDSDYIFVAPLYASAIERVYLGFDNDAVDHATSTNRNITLSSMSIDGAAVPVSQFVINNQDGTYLLSNKSILIGYNGLQCIRKCPPGMVLGSAGCYPAALDSDFITSINAHPRLMLTDSRLQELREIYLSGADATLNRYVDNVLSQAESSVNAPPVLGSVDFLTFAVLTQRFIFLESFGYRWFKTSDPVRAARYAESVKSQMMILANLSDWNPSHFLDTAESSLAMSVGLDWIYDYLSAAERSTFADAIANKALSVAKPYFDDPSTAPWWVYGQVSNWRDICHGGLTIGALAIAERNPDLARYIIRNSVRRLVLPPYYYASNGALREGPGYGDLTAYHDAMVATALETAIGNDLTLRSLPGLSSAGDFFIDETGVSNRVFNYSDTWTPLRTSMSPVMMFFGAYDNAYSDAEHSLLSNTNKPIRVEHLIWYRSPSGQVHERPAYHYFTGMVESFVARSSWGDPDFLLFGVKAGVNTAEHAHYDCGNFIIDALGQRWAMDLGPESYTIESPAEGLYRNISRGHNVPLFGGQGQIYFGNAVMTRTQGDSSSSFAVVDMKNAYGLTALSSYQRGVMMIGGRSVLIQDEFQLAASCDVEWGMLTEAAVVIDASFAKAQLTLNGKTLTMEILSPPNATLAVESAMQPLPQTPNTGVSRIKILVPASAGATRLAVQFRPGWSGGETASVPVLKPLSSW